MRRKFSQETLLALEGFLLALVGLLLLFSTWKVAVLRVENVFVRQVVWFALGTVIFFLLRRFDYRRWEKLSALLYVVFFLLLLLVLAVGSGRAGRWINFGVVNFQPAEFFKVILILVLARYFSTRDVRKFSVLFSGLLMAGVPAVLVVFQPNLGTALLLLILFFFMAYIAGAKKKHLLVLVLIGAAMSPLFWMMLKGYQKERLLIFLNPWKDPLGEGYNILQSKITIGSGGIFGKGFLQGTQTKLAFLPAYNTDFIFCVLAEQFGLAGVVILFLLYYSFLSTIWKISDITQDEFGKLVGAGIMLMFLAQVFVNVGMAVGILPVAGIPLPFLSYGGSSLLVSFIALALVYNIRKNNALF